MISPNKKLLVIDDEDSICLAFEKFFMDRNWEVRKAGTVCEGATTYGQFSPDVVFMDVRLPDGNGLDLLEQLANQRARVVVISAYGGLDTVVQAIQGSAYDYLAKPIDLDEALALAERAAAERRAAIKREGLVDHGPDDLLIGRSVLMQDAYKLIARAAGSDSPVLIQGETGTGKELAAQAIHQFGPRHEGPLVALNCGAMPIHLIESELFGHVRGAFTGADSDRPGRFELADGGTLLLDEVADLPTDVQVKLLRVLDSSTVERVGSGKPRKFDVRIIAATNRHLGDEVAAGRFRLDLYHRLAVLRINMPALRERREDVPLLAEHFLRRLRLPGQAPPDLGPEAAVAMAGYDWPGNVRELRNVIEYAVAVAPDKTIRVDDLPEAVRAGSSADPLEERLCKAVVAYAEGLAEADGGGRHQRTLAMVERALIRHAMGRHHDNQSEAARFLGLHRNTLGNKLREWGQGQEP